MRNIEQRDGSPDFTAQAVAVREPEQSFRALRESRDTAILEQFTPEQQAEIRHKQQILSSLAYFTRRDERSPWSTFSCTRFGKLFYAAITHKR